MSPYHYHYLPFQSNRNRRYDQEAGECAPDTNIKRVPLITDQETKSWSPTGKFNREHNEIAVV